MKTRANQRFRILQIIQECHEHSHDPNDLAEEIVAAFPRAQYEVTSAYLHGVPVPGMPQSRADHVHYFCLPDSALKGIRLSLLRNLYRYCQRFDFDVVICHRYKPVSAMLLLNQMLRIPVCIGISHGFGEFKTKWRRFYARTCIDELWQFVGVSSAVAQYLRDQHCGFTEKNTLAISNAIDIDETVRQQYGKAEARRLLGLPQEPCIVGAIGRLVPVKGHIYLIRAFYQISRQFPGAQLAIIGEGRSRAELEAAIARFGLGDRVHLSGWRSDAKRYARAFDIFVMPSLSEGFGLALVEGMAASLPVIGSDIPAMREMISGAGGIAVAPKDVEGLSAAMSEYLGLSEESRSRLGENSYAYLRTSHPIENYRNSYLKLVQGRLVSD